MERFINKLEILMIFCILTGALLGHLGSTEEHLQCAITLVALGIGLCILMAVLMLFDVFRRVYRKNRKSAP